MAKRQGLRLNLPGAPNSPHTIPEVAGFYYPDVPTPVGEEGELSLETARALAKDESIHLELVDIPAGEVKACEKLAAETLTRIREGRSAEVAAVRGQVGRQAQATRDRAATEKE